MRYTIGESGFKRTTKRERKDDVKRKFKPKNSRFVIGFVMMNLKRLASEYVDEQIPHDLHFPLLVFFTKSSLSMAIYLTFYLLVQVPAITPLHTFTARLTKTKMVSKKNKKDSRRGAEESPRTSEAP